MTVQRYNEVGSYLILMTVFLSLAGLKCKKI